MSSSATAIIILGASGDLTKRKLLPALNKLFEQGEFDSTCAIIGSGRSHYTNDQFRELFKITGPFNQLLYYHQGITGLKQFLKQTGTFSKIDNRNLCRASNVN